MEKTRIHTGIMTCMLCWIAACFFFSASAPGIAWGFDVSARVNQVRIAPSDTIRLQVVVDGGKADLDLSPIVDFQILSRGTSTSRSYVNGVWSHKVTYTYILSPLTSGTLSIPALTIRRKGETARTEPISIEVSSQAGQSQDNPARCFARAQISRNHPVAGQPLVYTFSLFCGQPIADARLQPPSFTGFSAKEIDSQRQNKTQIINGQEFRVISISYLLLPQQPGDITIESASVMVRVMTKQEKDPFEDFFDNGFSSSFFSGTQTRTLRISSRPIPVTVRPLPPYKGKGTFSGLVGTFVLKASVDKTTLGVGESATLTFEVSGRGNIMDAGPPQGWMPDKKAFKIYADTPKEEIQISDQGYSGKKIFQQALVPLTPGVKTILPASLIYFDTETNTYQTLATPSFDISVTARPGDNLSVSAKTDTPDDPGLPENANSIHKKEVTLLNQDILDIRESPRILSLGSGMGFWFFVSMTALPPAILALFFMAWQLCTRKQSRTSLLTKEAKKALTLARKAHPDSPQSWELLHGALTRVIWAKAGKTGQNSTPAEVENVLQQQGAASSDIKETLQVMEKIDSVRFGGKQPDAEDYGRCLSRINKWLCLVLMILGTWAGVYPDKVPAEPGPPSQNFSPAFVQAVKEYRAGEFEKAAQTFERIAEKSKNNADIFYNTGNAWFKAGNMGRAILWYERARIYAPNDPDLRYNLNFAREKTLDQQDTDFSLSHLVLFWHGYIPVGYVQAAALAMTWLFCIWAGVCVVRKKRIFSLPGMLSALIALGLFLAVGINQYARLKDTRAVIVQDVVPVRSGTSPQATRLFDLHAGAVVKSGEHKNGYMKIFWTKNKVGWVKIGHALDISLKN